MPTEKKAEKKVRLGYELEEPELGRDRFSLFFLFFCSLFCSLCRYIVMAYVVMPYMVMACVAVAYIVMGRVRGTLGAGI